MRVEQGIVTKADDPNHKQKATHSLTEHGIELLPVLARDIGRPAAGVWVRIERLIV